MSEWHVRMVTLPEIQPHPNADNLGIVDIDGYPVVVNKNEWHHGDRAIFVPIDSIMPDTPQWVELLGSSRRVVAKKLRGVYSQGMLIPAPSFAPLVKPGHMHAALHIKKYVPPEELSAKSGGNAEVGPEMPFPCYTDIEGLRKWPKILTPGEEVIITEKVHGSNARFMHDGTRLWCGSRNMVKAPDDNIWWWRIAKKLDLASKFQHFPGMVFYGEIYGTGIQNMNYGTEMTFRLFDVFHKGYVQYSRLESIAHSTRLPIVPTLYNGPWHPDIAYKLAEGKSTIGGDHVREGVVIRPVQERYDNELGRCILKLVGEGYNLLQSKKAKP